NRDVVVAEIMGVKPQRRALGATRGSRNGDVLEWFLAHRVDSVKSSRGVMAGDGLSSWSDGLDGRPRATKFCRRNIRHGVEATLIADE
ncbi:MAG: hypothetical protein ACR2JO_11220, partial [Mycobacteriales bacterium]